MGIAHSSDYQNLEGKLFVDESMTAWEYGSEYVRFLDTTWSDVRAPIKSSAGDPVYCQKVIKVQGCESPEIYYMSKESLIRGLGGDLRQASKFVNSKKNYELFCQWRTGCVQDKVGRSREINLAEPAVDATSGEVLRRISLY